MKHLAIDEFIEHVRHMPDIEAREQIELRKDDLAAQQAVITLERARITDRCGSKTAEYHRLGQELTVIASDQGRLTRMLKEVNERMSRINWAKAVTAIYGQEGFTACRTWIAMNYEQESQK